MDQCYLEKVEYLQKPLKDGKEFVSPKELEVEFNTPNRGNN